MATKKYLSYDRLTEYDALIKAEIADKDSSTLSTAKSYVNDEIGKITSGTVVVSEAEHAEAADSATKLSTERTITLSGDVTGSVKFDGSKDITLSVDVTDNGHGHTISNITGLETALSGKASTSHTHGDIYYTETEIDNLLLGKAAANHNHDDDYDSAGSATTALADAKTYVNNEIKKITSGTITVPEAEHASAADSASHLSAERTITLGGDATGSVNFDGSKDVTLTVDVTDNGHAHVISNITGLETALSGKAAASHSHNDVYYTETEIDDLLSDKANSTHDHDGAYDAAGSATTALADAKTYTDTKFTNMVGSKSVSTQISDHNTSNAAHSDIRTLISGLSDKLSNFLDVDDTTTDQLSEIITMINNNKGTLDSITTNKVNVSDIVDNLTTSSTSKVLSANQGVAIKALIDALQQELDSHEHAISDVTGLQEALNGKADASHGTHVTFGTTAPVMDGTAAVGTATTVARSDHKHPSDTSRASKTEFDTHVADATKHITSAERTNWGTAYTHSQADHAPSNAQANVIESIKVNGTAQTITGKSVNITVPTDNASLSNGAGYLVASDIVNKADKATTLSGYGITNAYTKSEIDAKTVVDTALSSTSTNPVQNKIVNSALISANSAITANTRSIDAHTTAISNLQTAVSEIQEITSAEIQALFA